MKAIVFDTFGGTEVLHEAETEVPEPGPGQVCVRVQAVGVNPLDGKIRSGTMQAIFPTTAGRRRALVAQETFTSRSAPVPALAPPVPQRQDSPDRRPTPTALPVRHPLMPTGRYGHPRPGPVQMQSCESP
jgi:hypothetical protein